jgi:coenzyme F420-reducing hydrogenase gamma subunit
VLWVVGTITHKMSPVLKTIYDQMAEPKWVIAFGACAASGGFYQNYAVLQGIDRLIPVDVYIAGCPPRPEAVLDGLMELQHRIQNDGPTVESGMLNPSMARHREQKLDQLSHYFEIPDKQVLENMQNPKSNRSAMPGYRYSEEHVVVRAHMGYDSPADKRKQEALREES